MKPTVGKSIFFAFLSLFLLFASACTKSAAVSGTTTNGSVLTGSDVESQTAVSSTIPASEPASEAVSGNITTHADTVINLLSDRAEITGSGASAEGSAVTITEAKTYLLVGALTDGQIIVNVSAEAKVTLILNGVNITCSTGPAISVLSSPKKTVITLAEGSINLLADGSNYTLDTSADADNPSAAIYSKDDLSFNGGGTLYVTGNFSKGIFSKDDLEIEGGTLYVTAVDDGIRGKDSVVITSGTITINAGADGLRTSNEEETDKGYIELKDCTLYITAAQDGIQAITYLTAADVTAIINSGGGSANASSGSTQDSWGTWGGHPGDGQLQNGTDTTAASDSAKAFKAGSTLTITSGSYTIDSSDDAVHSNDSITISGGSFYISSGDDGLHADSSLTISGGIIEIKKSYEGIESVAITVSDGTIRLISSDDGFNAAGGNDGSSVNGRPGQNGFDSVSNALLTISGGYIVMNASGDGLDSNGNVVMTGGTVIVYGPTVNDNGPLDYNGTFTLSGGLLLAVGSNGMAQSVSGSDQAVLAFSTRSSLSANTIVNITDSSGNSLLTFVSPKTFASVVFTTPSLVSGATYTVSTGGTCSGTAVDGIYSGGTYSGGSTLGTLSAK